MSKLFESYRIAGLELKNRFVRSATFDSSGRPDGQVSDHQLNLFSELTRGRVGLIISGITYVEPRGRISPVQNSIEDSRFLLGLKKLTEIVHKLGGKVAVQLFHGGRESARYYKKYGHISAIGPSSLQNDPYGPGPYKTMTEEDIASVIKAFGQAAGIARTAGFDAVQIHAAHAYLFSQFLSPHTNHRNDEWGGPLLNRLRIHREVYRSVRREVGDDFPILIKLGVQDGFSGGLEITEGLEAAEELSKIGFDALEISQGLRGTGYEEMEFKTGVSNLKDEAYFRNWARQVKERVSVPVIMVGGFRSFSLAEEVVQRDEADLVALSRPLISESGLIARWEAGDRSRSRCISCNKCLENVLRRLPVSCIFNRQATTTNH